MKILAFAEQRDSRLKKTSYEVVRTAKMIGDQLSAECAALLVGDGVSAIAAELGEYGVSRVIVVEDARLGRYSTTAYAKIVADIMRQENADILFLPASALGKDLSPRVSVKLEAGLATDCVALRVDQGDIVATRPVYAGKGLVDVRVKSPIKIFSLRPNVFPAGSPSPQRCVAEKKNIALADGDFGSTVTEIKSSKGKKDVAEADIIVSGGRGLRGPENFAMIEELASALNGAVGASRAVVDAGWRPHSEQVGQTGKTVAPSLYIAVGISGAVQHLAGMSSSKIIVAINKDKDAPIFSVADYGIVGDAFEIIPALTKELRTFKEQ
ncbi:MAG TPA: electron transfer flavoprotein subunit alpha/FixB family protein [Bacteroidota bacterium]|nr:electron transfer flavoprotein subunit alpha/FixB family protein [Bacteroidota bacterium]